jgi:hypothetical protein
MRGEGECGYLLVGRDVYLSDTALDPPQAIVPTDYTHAERFRRRALVSIDVNEDITVWIELPGASLFHPVLLH